MNRTTRALHKWLGITTGFVFLGWLVSGIVMELPYGSRSAYTGPYGAADWGEVGVAPAAAALAATEGRSTTVDQIELRRLGDRFVYRIVVDGDSKMIDASTAEVVTVDREAALALARTEFDTGADVGEVRLMEEREATYLFGPIPAWRIDWDDARGSVSYVAVQDGSVHRADHVTRTRAAITTLHTFTFLNALHAGETREALLVGISIVSVVTVATGYLLTVLLSAWYRRRRGSRSGTAPTAGSRAEA